MNYRFFILIPLLIFTACSRKSNPDANLKLLKAAENSDLKKLDEAIAEGADINYQDSLGNTALHYAAFFYSQYSRTNEKVFERLISFPDIDLDIRNKNDQTPILSTKSIDAIMELARAGAEVNIKDTSGSTPLHFAAAGCRLDVVAYLSETRGADINAKNKLGQTPLMETLNPTQGPQPVKNYAYCYSGAGSSQDKINEDIIRRKGLKHQIVLYLFNRGAEINVKYEGGETPLHYALQDGNKEIFDFLLNNGVLLEDAKKTNPYLMQFAVRGNNTELVYYLLGRDILLDITDKDENSALYIACQRGNLELVKILLNAGADPEPSRAKIPLHAAAYGGFTNCVKELLLNGAVINSTDTKNNNALHYLFRPSTFYYKKTSSDTPDYMGTLNTLLNAGINANQKNDQGNTPLNYYKFFHHRFISRIGKPEKFPPEPKLRTSDNKTTLFYVNNTNIKDVPIFSEYIEILKILKKHNTDFTIRNKLGKTLLFAATEYHDIPSAKFLLDHGVEINAVDKVGKTILDYLDEENQENSSVAEFKSFVKSRGALKASQLK
jgi:ankyrin repeat protein